MFLLIQEIGGSGSEGVFGDEPLFGEDEVDEAKPEDAKTETDL